MNTTRVSNDTISKRVRTGAAEADANVAILRGRCSNAAQRELPGGGTVVQFDVVTRLTADGRERNATVPVAWYDPPAAWPGVLDGNAEVLVIGAVQRRFFRVGGATQSRTEVRADRVVPVTKRREARRALDGVLAGLA